MKQKKLVYPNHLWYFFGDNIHEASALISYNSNYHVPLNILQQQTVSENNSFLKKH